MTHRSHSNSTQRPGAAATGRSAARRPAGAVPGPRAHGFTLIETLVVIGIIAGLLALVLVVGVVVVDRAGRAADTAAVRGVGDGVRQFERDFGFSLPLMYDGGYLDQGTLARPAASATAPPGEAGLPVFDAGGTSQRLNVFRRGTDLRFLQASTAVNGPNHDGSFADKRYSKLSLTFLLGGVGDASSSAFTDGVPGEGLGALQADGTFAGQSRFATDANAEQRGPYFQPRPGSVDLIRRYDDELENLEHGGAGSITEPELQVAFADANGRALRYYRWEPRYNASGEQSIDTPKDLNIPSVLLDGLNETALTDDQYVAKLNARPGLRAARWAIVGAGPDGLFGTEPIVELRARGAVGQTDADLRADAASDNAVELGS